MKDSGNSELKLGGLKAGESCIVRSVGGEGALRQHFLDMGIIPGTEITLIKYGTIPIKKSGYISENNIFFLVISCLHKQ